MLRSLQPLVFFESVTNGDLVLKVIISGDARQKLSVYDVLFCGGKPILYGR